MHPLLVEMPPRFDQLKTRAEIVNAIGDAQRRGRLAQCVISRIVTLIQSEAI